jgi:hypothetical protein
MLEVTHTDATDKGSTRQQDCLQLAAFCPRSGESPGPATDPALDSVTQDSVGNAWRLARALAWQVESTLHRGDASSGSAH